MRKHRHNETHPDMLDAGRFAAGPSIDALLHAMGPVIYFAQMRDGLIKIGYTTDLRKRRHGWEKGSRVLAFRYGTLDDELLIHQGLADSRAYGSRVVPPDRRSHGRGRGGPRLDALARGLISSCRAMPAHGAWLSS